MTHRGTCIASLALLAGCGGRSYDAAPGDADGGASAPELVEPAVEDAAAPVCTPATWYYDADGDGFGDATATSCTSPGASWVANGGDCDDGNARVHPGQTSWFGEPYVHSVTARSSYDYDCSAVEEEKPGQVKVKPTSRCDVVGSECLGTGYVPATRGTELYCGSTKTYYCRWVNISGGKECAGVASFTQIPFACR